LNAIWTIGQNVWNKKYTEIYQSAQAYNWSPGTVLFVQSFVEKFRERTFKLISSAYSNISTGDLAVLLGLSEQDAITRACPTSALHLAFVHVRARVRVRLVLMPHLLPCSHACP
jgi:hypothetical protein